MSLSWLKSALLPILVLAVVLSNLNIFTEEVNFIIVCILIAEAIFSSFLIILYYDSLPSQKNTILTHLMKLLLILNSIILLHSLVVTLAVQFYPDKLQEFFNYVPNLTCSLIMQEPNIAFLSNCLFAIMSFKTMALVFSQEFLSMNHNRVWRITLITMVITLVFEYTFHLVQYETICTKHNIYYIKTFLRFQINKEFVKYKPATMVYHNIVISLPHVIRILCYLWKFWNSRKHSDIRPLKTYTLDMYRMKKINSQTNSCLKYLSEGQKLENIKNDKSKIKVFTNDDSKQMEEGNLNVQTGVKTNVENLHLEIAPKTFQSSPKSQENTFCEAGAKKPLDCCDISLEDIENEEMVEYVPEQGRKYLSDHPKQYTTSPSTSTYVESSQNKSNKATDNGSRIFIEESKISNNRTKVNLGGNIEEDTKSAKKINNFIPRIGVEEIRILEDPKDTTGSQQTKKPQLLKTDYAIWLGTIIVILASFTVFVDSYNDGVILIHSIISKIFFLVLPTYWILRSEEKTKFVERRFNRFKSNYGFK